MDIVSRGLSETVAIVILIGLAISFSTAFLIYMQSDYGVRQDSAILLRVVEFEKMSTVVRLIHATEDSAAFLFRRLDNGGRVMFFLDNGVEYIDCIDIAGDVSGGAISLIGEYSIDDIMVVSRDGIYSYRYYARARGFPDSGRVQICTIDIDQNAVVALSLAKPVVYGYNRTVLESYNRRWRVYGSLRFRVVGASVNSYLYINGTEYPLRIGQNIRIDVDGRVGVLKLGQGMFIEAFNVFARAVYIDDALLARNVHVGITRGVAIDVTGSSLSIEIQPDPPGYIKVMYYGRPQLTVEKSDDDSYIKVVGWSIDRVRGLTIQLDQERLYAEGMAYAIYIVQRGFPAGSFIRTLRLYTITIISGTPYIVNVYEYRFGSS